MVVDICAAISSLPARLRSRRGRWTDGADADARRDVAQLSGPSGSFAAIAQPWTDATTDRGDLPVSAVKVEVHSSNSSSGAGSDENLSCSSSSDRGSEPGTAAGENDYEDIYEVRQRANGGGGGGHHHNHNHNHRHHQQASPHHGRGKESKSPSRDSGSHSRSGSMSSTGSAGVVGSGLGGPAVVVLHTSAGHAAAAAQADSAATAAAVTNVTVDGPTVVGNGTSNLMGCYEHVGVMTPGAYTDMILL